ncbi:MAG: hypothetical protein ABJA02_11745 [Acidobacteriota bacterium]
MTEKYSIEHARHVIECTESFLKRLHELEKDSKLTPEQLRIEHDKLVAEKESCLESKD